MFALLSLALSVMFFIVTSLASPDERWNANSTSNCTVSNRDILFTDIIDFDLLNKLHTTMRGKDQHELEVSFDAFIQAAGFEDLLDNYQEKIHGVIEKRLQDALILK